MPPWGRAVKPEELAALVSYVRSLQGSNPPNAEPAEGDPVVPEPIPGADVGDRDRAGAAGGGGGPRRGHERVFDVAPEEDLLYSLSADGKRKFMHPVVRKGRFWKIRRRDRLRPVRALLRAAAHPGRRPSRPC